ncbi:biotin biosynthesis protein BioY [Clostridium novyi B str. ATCC 27606]|uniref:Biotin transporter n=2 Tax=Clostridium TaxID=1485 RepID=A0AA40IS23_CLONO|nr:MULTISPECIES: biotin transporter BioY [Clostridium]KEI12424.1 biotin biosynthesis protein BioY [Clostridium novyi B str. ATCC 27606]KEI15321.1 biotin biosynthesis protein BioY [Clostridium novyi B str. NCTC 9691]KEI18026.1 biotin biosynthesis protein BioY [Clostridium haemolyticum NCTC 9693]KGM99793.1 biotin biosynthesis protein BioY [Clostridium haemolyticum NCTC 8350]OOB76096.1 biotin biosynthesis protein BioY [Clostridium haemolyticum]
MKTKDLVLVSIFAALTAVGAFIKIPIPNVPFTLQFFFCAFAGMLLGSKLGALSQIIYVVMGLIGIPVFTEGGGIMYVLKPTFGYLIGFIVGAYVIGYIAERIKELTFFKSLGAILTGLFFIYFLGIIHFYLIMNLYLGKATSLKYVIYWGGLVFIGGDLILSVIIAFTSKKILKRLKIMI